VNKERGNMKRSKVTKTLEGRREDVDSLPLVEAPAKGKGESGFCEMPPSPVAVAQTVSPAPMSLFCFEGGPTHWFGGGGGHGTIQAIRPRRKPGMPTSASKRKVVSSKRSCPQASFRYRGEKI